MTDRAIVFCLLEILREYSDENHILTMHQLKEKLAGQYDLSPDRRTIYSALALLRELGHDVSQYEENGKGYNLRSRSLEQPEVQLLTDAVYAFPFLPAKQSADLVKKLQQHLSVYQRKNYRHLAVVRAENKTANRQVFWCIDQLEEAISQGVQVQFTYLQYGMDKQLHPRRQAPYVVNPYGMVYMNDHYYLICNLRDHPNSVFYRIDRMRDVELLETPLDTTELDLPMVQNAVNVFSGKPELITLRCSKEILSDVLDKFGTGITLQDQDESTFLASFQAPPAGIRYWALQYLPCVEVLKPEWLREQVVESVKGNLYGVG